MMQPPLAKILQQQIIPWVEQYGITKLAVAAPSLLKLRGQAHQVSLPDGMSVSGVPLKSKRTPIRGRRLYGDVALIDARWPKDHLESCKAPIFAYVVSGAVKFPVGDYLLHCQPGHGILMPPGVAHSDGSHLFLDDSIPHNLVCQILNVRPYKGGVECWLSHTQNGQHFSHRTNEACRIPQMQIVSYIESLTEEIQKYQPHYEKVCTALLMAILNLLLRELENSPNFHPASLKDQGAWKRRATDDDPIARIEEYIHSHLGDSLTLGDAARRAYMSERSFTDKFRHKTGYSFKTYLTEVRFAEACNLLKNTDWSIEMISTFVGLTPERLRAIFRLRMNVSPSSFRDESKSSKKC